MPTTRSRLSRASTSNISDALDKLGLPGACEGIVPMVEGVRMIGPAFTAKYVPYDRKSPGTVGDFLDSVGRGKVVVIDNAGRTGCTVWGDIMTTYAVKKRLTGTLIDGVCRDIDGIRGFAYPVFARGHFMRTGKGRVQVESTEKPVMISGVKVRPGDLVVGDVNGVVVVPAERADEVAQVSDGIAEAEEGIVEDIGRGVTLAEARKEHGYHTLQSKSK
ncbi:MAG: RraA family protein [Thaumarchaeota archaeon]|nr:RraA family protein [Nitrososphaerota archaeon]